MHLSKPRWYALALLLLLPIWLHSYEAAFWRVKLGGKLLVWLCVSSGIALCWRALRREHAPLPRWLRLALVLSLVIGLLSTATFWVADGDQRSWPDEEVAQLSYGEPDPAVAPPGVQVLRCSPSFVVFGRARGDVERFVGTSSGSSPLLLSPGLVPTDFDAHARLVEPKLRELAPEQRRYVVAEDFLRWQFPRHILLLALPAQAAPERRSVWGCSQVATPAIVITLDEDNRTDDSGVYPVDPLFEELRDGELPGRIRSYANLLRYAFITPHDRRDLVNDAYFAASAGDAPSERH